MNESSEKSNAPETASTRPQTAREISSLLMEWMEEEKLDYHRAAISLGISDSILVLILNGGYTTTGLLEKLSQIVPGIHKNENYCNGRPSTNR